MRKINRASGIYQIVNKVNKKIYVGSSVNLHRRRIDHLTSLSRGTHDNSYLQRAFNKEPDAFEFFVVEYIAEDDLILIEQQYLDILWDNCVNCYNIQKTAGNTRGYKHTDEAKEKISKIQKGRKRTQESKELARKRMTGKKYSLGYEHSECAKDKISKARRGLKISEQTKLKISETKRGKKRNKLRRNVAVIQTLSNGQKIHWKNAALAAKTLKLTQSCISDCCRGKTKTYKGYSWRFADNE